MADGRRFEKIEILPYLGFRLTGHHKILHVTVDQSSLNLAQCCIFTLTSSLAYWPSKLWVFKNPIAILKKNVKFPYFESDLTLWNLACWHILTLSMLSTVKISNFCKIQDGGYSQILALVWQIFVKFGIVMHTDPLDSCRLNKMLFTG